MRLTIRDIQQMKTDQQKIVLLTAYDATSAQLCEMAEVPVILVGDTLGMVVQGHESTIPVTLDEMIYHCSIVARVTQRPLIVGDLPFMTYSINPEQALMSAAQLVQKGRASAVKLEGGRSMAPTIQRIVEAGIPVMGHIGLTPQSVNQLGGFRVQGRNLDTARKLVADARAVQEAGAFALVLELVPAPLAALITETLTIPTIGIGAGPNCDGQVQVFHDILGLFTGFLPKHTRRYLNGTEVLIKAISQYVRDVQTQDFPTLNNAFAMDEQILLELRAEQRDAHS